MVAGTKEPTIKVENPRYVVRVGFGKPTLIHSAAANGLDEAGEQRSDVHTGI